MVPGAYKDYLLLLKKGYTFNPTHQLKDVAPFEFEGPGYPKGGSTMTFQYMERINEVSGRAEFKECTGIYYGAVIYNEAGLIAHLPIWGQLHDSALLIRVLI
jgi:hypothetical protein